MAGVAVVTGASRGIGRGIACALGEAGFSVLVNYQRDECGANATAAAIRDRGGAAATAEGDVANPDTASMLVETAQRELGGLDVWVNNAGVSTLAPLIDTQPDDLRRMHDVNVMGTFYGLRAAAQWWLQRSRPGRVVNVSSEVGLQAFALLGAYAATKFAVVGLTQAAAIELAAAGITVNAVCPGTAETDMVLAERASEVVITGASADATRAAYLAAIPAGRFCTPADVGAAVVWLAGPGAAYVTGQSLCINGGSVLH
jgi:meso-butanediol dehydrogenase/(S,S)-butanediol dehydrogenase/diacetyl reductase